MKSGEGESNVEMNFQCFLSTSNVDSEQLQSDRAMDSSSV